MKMSQTAIANVRVFVKKLLKFMGGTLRLDGRSG